MSDPGAPIETSPPRTVHPWTRVAGHLPVVAGGRGNGFCRCGERQTDERSAEEWRDEHLARAWPVLLERVAGEPLTEWRARLIAAIGQARIFAEPEARRLIEATQAGSGEPDWVANDLTSSLEDRLKVLEHQLAGRPFNRMVGI